jgi:AmmeMemoRadiSam system protein A
MERSPSVKRPERDDLIPRSESGSDPGSDAGEDPRGRVLLALARESLQAALGRGVVHPRHLEAEPWLQEPGATFVTLREDGELRGCVGSIRAYRPLGEDVVANARAAALYDSRFPPVAPAELPRLRVEVSLLSPPAPLPAASEAEAIERLRPGVDGVILEDGPARSTFLPQVWEQLPEPRRFLAYLKQKAGLHPDSWSPTLRLWTYAVAKWEEE